MEIESLVYKTGDSRHIYRTGLGEIVGTILAQTTHINRTR